MEGFIVYMEINIKQVSSLETIFSFNEAMNMKNAAVFGGERFSYQIVITPSDKYRYEIKVNESEISNFVTVYSVKDAVMDFPCAPENTSNLLTTEPGFMPDILIPLNEEKNRIVLKKDKIQILWVRVDLPENFPAGEYPITLEFKPLQGAYLNPVAEKSSYATMNIEVLPFTLPKQDLKYTRWFYADCIADYYNVPVYSERHWELIEAYMKTAVETGINVILTPIITPPLDTAPGLYRTNVQLVDIKVDGDNYIFNFDKLGRWIDICLKCGVEYFEMSQLFSQWGLKFTPGIVAEVDGKQEYIFGWHVYAYDKKYSAFLKQFIPALVEYLKDKKVFENTIFHISDEPHEYCREAYKYGHELIKPLIGSAKIMDALSEYRFYEDGLVDIPATYTASMADFLGKNVEEQWVYYAEDNDNISIGHLAAPPYRNRVLGIQLFKYDIKGFLHWGYNYYNTALSYHKVDPYLSTSAKETMASGGPFNVYPAPNGAYLSPRALIFYEGLQDLAALKLLEAFVGREMALSILEDEAKMEITFSKYPENTNFLPNLRRRIAQEIGKAKNK